ncbi:small acid-soluble spore protein Tlp [Domibacillus indicus]|uniref:small acid-soluble spore protein Tlp n=1 Tax=Domibacillus indicus TaxID=1437523 RepID=UPI000617E503|nr:small acid-soluble spore protein Tlp [Domibacillus indicus]
MTHQRPKPDDRSDNVQKLRDMVQNTIGNIEAAEESMGFANEKQRAAIKAKNERREESIEGMREEIHDEAAARRRK